MKRLLSQMLKLILKKMAQWTLKKYRPGVIAVTGSVGKTSAKEAIAAVLRSFRRLRASHENFNNDIGVPLTILGPWQKIEGFFFWPKVAAAALKQIIVSGSYPELLVLEYAADRPGDLDYLISIARPQIAVVTAVGAVPVHVEFYPDGAAVAREKEKIIAALPTAGFAVLNADDPAVAQMKHRVNASVFTYGFAENAQLRITQFENRIGRGRPAGISCKLEYGQQSASVRIDGAVGKGQAYAAAAAACVCLGFGLNLPRIAEALVYYRPPSRRMKVLAGVRETFLIDDTYNASPLSMEAALEAVRDVSAKRKVGILGDMLELGRFSLAAHQAVGELAARTFQLLITVGERGKIIAETARAKGLSPEKVFSLDSADEAAAAVIGWLKPGDLVLIKASRGIGLDRVVEEIRYKR